MKWATLKSLFKRPVWLCFFLVPMTNSELLGPTAEVHKTLSPPAQPIEKNCKKGRRAKFAKGKYETGDVTTFVRTCLEKGVLERFCLNLTHPNQDPESMRAFRCTYPGMPHVLIPKDESEWTFAFEAALILQTMARETKVCIDEIYNWYRPEPYNRNVDGRPNRHPKATAIDVKFCTKEDAKKAHRALCELYKKKSIWALGSYPSGNKLHIGVRPELHTTWGPYPCRK